MKRPANIPRWQRELENFKGIKNTFILEGNIRDIYLDAFASEDECVFDNIEGVIRSIFGRGRTKDSYSFVSCNPIFGFYDIFQEDSGEDGVQSFYHKYRDLIENDERIKNKKNTIDKDEKDYMHNSYTKISEVTRQVMTCGKDDTAERKGKKEKKSVKSIAVIVDLASHFISEAESITREEKNVFMNLLYGSLNAIRGNGKDLNTLILLVEKMNDLPVWFYYNNPNVRMITIPNPERFVRQCFITERFDDILSENDVCSKLIDQTDKMKLLEVDELRRYYYASEEKTIDIADAVSLFKYGFKDNPWKNVTDKIPNDEDLAHNEIIKRVIGQKEAVEKVTEVLKRAAMGLSGLQHSSGRDKPRGIFFLAGPTGTGKTELVKAVAVQIFGDEKSILRFDMSEYMEAHSDQKLFGAPPGYVGYDQGGQLTNGVRNNPFSILLFDEIEKAHPSIMDKFLQILEDGRLTDGQGRTVYFSETLIFFTSNIGVSRTYRDDRTGEMKTDILVGPDKSYEDIRKSVKNAMDNSFKQELRNRIGDNVIVFNYIDSESTEKIIYKMINNINENIEKEHGVQIIIGNEVYGKIKERCLAKEIRIYGGRGIGNEIESYYLTPLAVYLFDNRNDLGEQIELYVDGGRIKFRKANKQK